MVCRNLLLNQPKKARCIVVEDISLLCVAQEWRVVDRGDRSFDHSRPYHLNAAKHDTIAEACIDML